MNTMLVAIRCRAHNRTQNKPLALWQVAFDAEDKRCYRELRHNGKKLKPGAWAYTPRPLGAGLFCEYCMAEGTFAPLLDDRTDLADLGLGDGPVVFHAPAHIQAAAEAEALRERFPDRVAHVLHVPAIEAQYAETDVLASLHPVVRRAITEKVLPPGARLYRFQSEAIAAALRGEDVLTTTPTASGKSLCYWAPTLHRLLSEPNATMIYVSPLVALTDDQFAGLTRYADDAELWSARAEVSEIPGVLRELRFGGQTLTVARYEGQTHQDFRPAIRAKRPRIILTTPDMLHMGLLRGADSQWSSLFAGLKTVVFDELHSYRGVMGSQFANLMRRLLRLTARAGQDVQILSASATVARPAETAQLLLGRPSTVVDASIGGAARAARTLVVVDSASGEETRALATEAKNVITHMMAQKLPTLAFVQSIAEGGRVRRLVETELKAKGLGHVKVEAFSRELLKGTKKELIESLRQGNTQCLISTRALSMGIDIHQVAAAVLVGYPGSIAEFWQQAGRAGRGGEGLVVYIAGSSPVDQFFVQNPDMLHKLEAEPTFCNPDNPLLVRAHLLQAVGERVLKDAEVERFGPTAPAALAALEAEGLLLHQGDTWVRTEAGDAVPAPAFRNIGFAVAAYDQDRKAVAQLDLGRAHRAYHRKAVVQVEGIYYEVKDQKLDTDAQRGEIRLRRVDDATYVTRPSYGQHVRVLEAQGTQALAAGSAGRGPVRVTVTVDGYTREPLPGRVEEATYQPLGSLAPKPLTYDTQGIWLALGPGGLPACEQKDLAAGLFSAAGALRLAIAITQMCDPSDLGATGVLAHPDLAAQPGLFVFDAISGGIGISEAAFGDLAAALRRAHAILADCPYCSTHPESLGCPQCVTSAYGQEDGINRHVALALLGGMLGA